jgi:ectoine hydroxylase-related dioxygenase (phytanoyl-CoA dioxygenase family)
MDDAPMNPEIRALLPDDEEVAFYREHGWYRSRRILSNELLDEAVAASDRHFAGQRDWPLPISSGYSDWKPSDGDTMRNGQATALQNRVLRQLALHPAIGAIATRLSGSPTIRYFDDSILYKPANVTDDDTVVGWHTDRAYWGTCTSEDMLTAWIPFQDTPEEMGPVVYIDRSHEWDDAEQLRTFHNKNLTEIERTLAARGPIAKHAMTLLRGEVSFHNCRTVHGSGPNRGVRPRRAMAVHLQDVTNQYRHHIDTFGRPWHLFNDDLARKNADGTPDYSDPNVFPRLWPPTKTA